MPVAAAASSHGLAAHYIPHLDAAALYRLSLPQPEKIPLAMAGFAVGFCGARAGGRNSPLSSRSDRRPAGPVENLIKGANLMLRFVEEIVLLLLRDEGGRLARVPAWSLNYALAGGALMDLAMENRIDTDPESLILIDAAPVGDNILDPVLARIAAAAEKHDAAYWLDRIADGAEVIYEAALERLVQGGILERRDDRILWVFRSRRYPAVDGVAEREVKLRIMGVLFSDEIPDPRDIMLICLADACGIFSHLLTRRELNQVTERIEEVRRFDLIGQAMSQAIQDIEISVAASVQQYMH